MKLKIKKIFLYSIMWPHILVFYLSKNKKIIREDVERRRLYRRYNYENNFTAYFCEVLWRDKEFRNVFYLRIGRVKSFFLNMVLPALEDVDLEDCKKIGGGYSFDTWAWNNY